MREGPPDHPLVAVSDDELIGRQPDKGEETAQKRERRIEQDAVVAKGEPACPRHQDGRGSPGQDRGDRARARHHPHDQQPENEKAEDFQRLDQPGAPQEVALQDLLQHLGVDRHAGHVLAQRRRADIQQARRRGADEDDVARDLRLHLGVKPGFQKLPGGHVKVGRVLAVAHPELAVRRRRDVHARQPQRGHEPAQVGRAHQHQGAFARGDPQPFDRQGGQHAFRPFPDHRNAPDDGGRIEGADVDDADPGRSVTQRGQHRHGRGKGQQAVRRDVAHLDDARLAADGPGRRIGRVCRAEHHVRRGDGPRKDHVVVQRRQGLGRDAGRQHATALQGRPPAGRATSGQVRGRARRRPLRRPRIRSGGRRSAPEGRAARATVQAAEARPRRCRARAPEGLPVRAGRSSEACRNRPRAPPGPGRDQAPRRKVSSASRINPSRMTALFI